MPPNTGPQYPVGNSPSAPGVIPSVGYNSTQPVTPGSVTSAGGGNGFWGSIGSFLLDHWEDLAKLGLSAYTTKEAIQNAKQANDYTSAALGMAGQDYDSRAPFRAQAATKLGATRPDLSSVFADPGNPYKKGRQAIPVVGGGSTGPTPTVNGYDGPPISGTVGDGGALPRPIYTDPIGHHGGPISGGPQAPMRNAPTGGATGEAPLDPMVWLSPAVSGGRPPGAADDPRVGSWPVDPATGKRIPNRIPVIGGR